LLSFYEDAMLPFLLRPLKVIAFPVAWHCCGPVCSRNVVLRYAWGKSNKQMEACLV
jgi:hypothetical protein